MSSHLLAVAVGPVQEFIAAARRTRDLWFGSYLLSEVSRAVAVAVSQDRELIFPASTDNALAPNVANVVLVELMPGKDPAAAASAGRDAARKKWREFADSVIDDKDIVAIVRNDPSSEQGDIWTEQVDDVVEFYAAWVPMTGNYREDRTRVMRLLAGRKNCRDFRPAVPHQGLPKSSLDGLRDTVLRGPAKDEHPLTYRASWSKAARRKLRLRTGEQLDVVGIVKRAAGGTRPYPSVARVAADPWIRGLLKAGGRSTLDRLAETCRGIDAVHRLDTDAFPQYREFPLEGTTLFRSRHHEWFEEVGDVPRRPEERREPPPWYGDVDKALLEVERVGVAKHLGEEPNPYLAVVVADGDQIGKTLSNLDSVGRHRDFSRTLAKFAEKAREIVQDRHYGVLVYAGGDDVLAFVPVDRCLDCARQLHDEFENLLAGYATPDTKPTLSVGIAIGHFMENLEDLREYAQAAEKDAKTADAAGVKDALAVHLHKRGGGPIKVRGKWADGFDARLKTFAEWLAGRKLPNRLVADMIAMAKVYERWDGDPSQAILADLLRVIRAKQPGGGAIPPEVVTVLCERVKNAAALRQLADELLVARQIAAACRQADGRGDGEEP